MDQMKELVYDNCIKDALTYRLNNKEALVYIEARTGEKKSETWLIGRKKRVAETDPTMAWLSEHTRIGYVETHRRLIDEMLMVGKKLLKKYLVCNDDEVLIKLADAITQNNKRIGELNLGMPIIAKMKMQQEVRARGQDTTGNTISPAISA